MTSVTNLAMREQKQDGYITILFEKYMRDINIPVI